MPSFNPNARRPPPPLPGQDPIPPPVPNRPTPQKPSSQTANNPPSPPSEAPPALPQRPTRNNIPPPPPELEPLEQEDYEDINTPTLISLPPPRHQPAAPPSQFSGANSGRKITPPQVKTKPQIGIRSWESLKEVGNKLPRYSDLPNAKHKTLPWNGTGGQQSHVTHGAINSPNQELLEESEPTDYEIPEQFDGSSSSNFNSSFSHQSMPQRQGQAENDDSPCWSESEWDDDSDEAEADDCYVMPAQDDDDCEYIAPDPVTPNILPISSTKQSKGMPMLNSADLQIRRLNLSSSSHPEPKPPPAAKDTKNGSSVNAVTKMLQEKIRFDKDKPPPPPKLKRGGGGGGTALTPPTTAKPGAFNKTHTTDVATSKTTESPTTTKDKKKRDSGDNSSAGSVSSLKEAHKKKDLPALPTSSTTKVPTLPVGLVHDLKNRIQSPNSEKEFKLNADQTTCTSPKKPTRVPEPQPAAFEADEIYDDGVSVSENLSVYDWFHDAIDRKEADRRIQSIGKIGTFLIRTSSGGNKAPDGNRYPYTLVVQTKAEVKNLRIRQRPDNKYAIGTSERADEICFLQLYELVEHHRENNVKVFQKNGDQQDESVKLILTPKKT